MADIKIEHGASFTLGITLTAVASSPTYVNGKQSDTIDNTTNKFLDYLLSGKAQTFGSGLTAGSIRVYVFGSVNDTPIFPDPFGSVDLSQTVDPPENLGLVCRLFEEMPTNTTANETYEFSPKGIASYFGGVLPKHWGMFLSQNTGQNIISGTFTATGVFATN